MWRDQRLTNREVLISVVLIIDKVHPVELIIAPRRDINTAGI